MSNLMNNYIMHDHPCRRDCPDRKPGCNCEKRKAFQAVKEERKEKIRRHRNNENALDELAMPKSALKKQR